MTSFDKIIFHVLNSLPDSTPARKDLLGAALDVMTAKHPARKNVASMLISLEEFERAQAELPLKFEPPKSRRAHNGDGDGNGKGDGK